jgi:hypothetical protein
MISEEEYEKEQKRLREQYEESGLDEDWEAWVTYIDRHVYVLKLASIHWHDAINIIRRLELVTALPPILRYRKAVLLNALSKNSPEAFELFMSLIRDESIEAYIRERSSGYVLKYYTHSLRNNEAPLLFDQLQHSKDEKALQLLEDYDVSLLHERQEDALAEEDKQVEAEEALTYKHSDINGWGEANTRNQILQIYDQHRPEHYDLYLDWSQGKWLAKGTAMDLSASDIKVLFRMASEGVTCTAGAVYKSRYNRELEPGNKQESGRLYSYYRRLKIKLKSYGIITEDYIFKSETRYFVIYPEQRADDIFAD